MTTTNFMKKLELEDFAVELAQLSAIELSPNNWWGDDTNLGNLHAEIKTRLRITIKQALSKTLKELKKKKFLLRDRHGNIIMNDDAVKLSEIIEAFGVDE